MLKKEVRTLMKKRKLLFIVLMGYILIFSGCRASSENLSEPLSDKEIRMFNETFFNGSTDNMNNQMLASEYDQPANIDLFQLFYNGNGGAAGQVSEEEVALLTESYSEAPVLDIVKVTAEEMNAVLVEKTGVQLEETQQKGLGNFYYLEQYDSFYNIAGDTNFNWCTVTSGVRQSGRELILEYTKENEDGQWRVVLEETDDGYLFVSNTKIEQGH